MPLNTQEPESAHKLVSFWKHHPIADQKAEALAERTLWFQQKFNCDFIKITPAGSWQAVCHGVEDIWNGDHLGRRIITKTIINTPHDWHLLSDFPETQPALMTEIIGACRIVKEKSTDSKPLFSTVFCPVSQAIQMAGLAVFLQHIETNPNDVLSGLERITKNTLYIIDELIRSGSDGIYFVTQHMRHGAIPPAVYKNFGQSFDERCLYACRNLPYNIFHIHGENIYLSISNLPPNWFIHYEYCEETNISADWQNRLQEKLLRGLQAIEMAQCKSADDIHQLIKEKSKGSILTAGCVLPLDFPDESIHQWMTVSKKF